MKQPVSITTVSPGRISRSVARVRPRRVGAGRDDALECDLIRALLVEELTDRPGHVPLPPTDEGLVDEPLEHPVGDFASALDRRELLLVLDRAEPFDEAATGHLLDGAHARSEERRV